MAFRIDNGAVLRSPRRTPDGALRVDATLTRTGVFLYRDGQGNVFREYRPADEVFNPDSLASFEGVIVTDDHPPVMVDASNAITYKRGRAGGVIQRDGIHMVGSLIIDDAALIAKMEAGKQEVSNGYECDLEMTPGVSPEGEAYDAIQRNIRGNHVAIVDAGRAGTARVRMDAAVQVAPAPAPTNNGSELGAAPSASDTKTPSVARATRTDAMDLEQLIAAFNALAEKVNTLAEKVAPAEQPAAPADEDKPADAPAPAEDKPADPDPAAAEKAKAEAKADKAIADAKAAAKAAQASVKPRVDLVVKALAAGVTSIKVDGKDVPALDAEPRALKLAVIAKLDGAEVRADKRTDDAYIDARFEIATENAAKNAAKSGKAFAQLAAIVNAPAKTDAAPAPTGANDPVLAARRQMIEDNRNAWKTLKESK